MRFLPLAQSKMEGAPEPKYVPLPDVQNVEEDMERIWNARENRYELRRISDGVLLAVLDYDNRSTSPTPQPTAPNPYSPTDLARSIDRASLLRQRTDADAVFDAYWNQKPTTTPKQRVRRLKPEKLAQPEKPAEPEWPPKRVLDLD